MGWLDVVDPGFWGAADVLADMGDEALGLAKGGKRVGRAVPLLGEVISGTQAVYHLGSAVYDGVTGDRDGAVNHGTQALWNGVGAIPAVSEAMGTAELVASGLGFTARLGAEATGHESEDIPGGLDDLAGSAMVALTNMAFGADDSNWIAPGDQPTGTRSGEIGAGMGAVGSAVGGILGGALGPLGMMGGSMLGGWLGDEAGQALGNSSLGEGPTAPTSGAKGNWWSQQGQAAHEALGGTGGGATAGAALGTLMMPGIGTVGGAIAGGLLGAADEAWNIF